MNIIAYQLCQGWCLLKQLELGIWLIPATLVLCLYEVPLVGAVIDSSTVGAVADSSTVGAVALVLLSTWLTHFGPNQSGWVNHVDHSLIISLNQHNCCWWSMARCCARYTQPPQLLVFITTASVLLLDQFCSLAVGVGVGSPQRWWFHCIKSSF